MQRAQVDVIRRWLHAQEHLAAIGIDHHLKIEVPGLVSIRAGGSVGGPVLVDQGPGLVIR